MLKPHRNRLKIKRIIPPPCISNSSAQSSDLRREPSGEVEAARVGSDVGTTEVEAAFLTRVPGQRVSDGATEHAVLELAGELGRKERQPMMFFRAQDQFQPEKRLQQTSCYHFTSVSDY